MILHCHSCSNLTEFILVFWCNICPNSASFEIRVGNMSAFGLCIWKTHKVYLMTYLDFLLVFLLAISFQLLIYALPLLLSQSKPVTLNSSHDVAVLPTYDFTLEVNSNILPKFNILFLSGIFCGLKYEWPWTWIFKVDQAQNWWCDCRITNARDKQWTDIQHVHFQTPPEFYLNCAHNSTQKSFWSLGKYVSAYRTVLERKSQNTTARIYYFFFKTAPEFKF